MIPGDYGGQRANMEHDSMAGTLLWQARLIWPQERALLGRAIAPGSRVLDLACGTGEILRRIRTEFEPSVAVGVDLFRGHLERAVPLPVAQADAHKLPFADRSFDLVCVRHLLQAIEDPVALLAEARRVGRRIHLLVEDYAGLLFDLDDMAAENHFVDVAPRFLSQGTDLYQGRRALRHVRAAGFSEIAVQPLMIDNRTGNREAFSGVLRYWKLGYARTLAGLLGLGVEEVEGRFDAMISAVLDPDRYCAWLLFVLSAKA